jgi:hypothetical protein
LFLVQGAGTLTTTPWRSADLLREFDDCAAAKEDHEARTADPAPTGARGSRKRN